VKVGRSLCIFLILSLFLLWIKPEFAVGEPIGASLLIVGPGDAMYEYWGHIGVIIEDDSDATSRFYDFGNFSFYADNFYSDFIMGRMIYLSSVTTAESFINRTMREDRCLNLYPLNFDREELRELDAALRWWVLPENQEYLYDYFLNNCSTLIRDILDDVMRGALRASTSSVPDRTYRHHARTGARPSFFHEVLLHFLLGEKQDEEISLWDLMFIPQVVGDTVLNFEYLGRDGATRVLADEKIVLKKSTRPPVPPEPRILWPWLLALGIALGLLWNAAGRLPRALIILLAGIPGLILGFLMFFTDHESAYNNINILSSIPTVLLGIIPLLGSRKKGIAERELTLSWIWTLNLAGVLTAFSLWVSGASTQNAGSFWALYGPLALMASRPGQYLRGNFYSRLVRFRKGGSGRAKQIRSTNNGD